ncbi:MAG: SDR family oxidoreductase [Dermatophilaceae bacterium]
MIVTGGAGFIGCSLAPYLTTLPFRVVAVDCLLDQVHPRQRRPAQLPPEIDLRVADVCDPHVWDRVLADITPRLVVHLAAETGTGQSLTESTRHARANVVGTTVMMDAFVRHGTIPDHVVLASSRAVYGEGGWVGDDGQAFYPGQRSHAQLARAQWDHRTPSGARATPLKARADTTCPNPSSVYGSTKLAQELILANWTQSYGVPLSVFRLQNVYGPGQSPYNSYTGIVTLFHRLAARGQTLDVYEDGLVGRDFVYIDDVVSVLAAGIASPPVGPPRVLDVGTGVVTTIAEAAATIAAYHGAPTPAVGGQFRDGDVRHAVADIGPTTQALGFRPSWSFSEGSASVARWLADGGFLD